MDDLDIRERALAADGLDLLGHPLWLALPDGRVLWSNRAARAVMTSSGARSVPRDGLAPLPDLVSGLLGRWHATPPETRAEGLEGPPLPIGPGAAEGSLYRIRIAAAPDNDHPERLMIEAWPLPAENLGATADRLLAQSAEVLGRLAAGDGLGQVLDAIVNMVESALPSTRCVVLLFEEDGQGVARAVAPSLPAGLVDAVGTLCTRSRRPSAAAVPGPPKRYVTRDVGADPLWEDHCDRAQVAGFSSVWSEPVLSPDGRAIGCVSFLRPHVATPGPSCLRLGETAARMVGLAVATEHRRSVAAEAEARLADSEATLRGLLDAAPALVFLKDPGGHYRAINHHFCTTYGLRQEDIIGRTLDDVFGRGPADVFRSIEHDLSPERPIVTRELDDPMLPGRSFSETKFLVHDRDGTLIGIGGYAMEITELRRNMQFRREAEQRLIESEAKFRLLFELCPVGIAIDRFEDGYGVSWNPAMLDIAGIEDKDVKTFSYMNSIPEEYHEQERQAIEELRRTGRHPPLERELVMPDGRRRSAILNGVLLENFEGQRAILTTVQDITQLKAAERALRLQSERLALAIEAGNIGVMDYAIADGNVTFDGRLAEIAGVGAEAQRMARLEDWLALVIDEDRPDLDIAVARAVGGEPFERRTVRIRRPDGELRHVRIDVQCLFEDGRPARLVGIVTDETDEVCMADALAARTREAEAASEAKSRFLANVSHEIRTPLNGVLGGAQLLAQSGLDKRQTDLLQLIESSGRTLVELIEDLLDISRIEAGALAIDFAQVSVEALLTEVLEAFGTGATAKGLALTLDIHAAAPRTVVTDRRRLRQVLVNLVANAIKFTEQGAVDVTVGPMPEGGLRIEVRDTGPGIPPDQQAEIFARFSRGDSSASRRHGGAGLGLAICRELVSLMRGQIGVRNLPGRGACFWLTLPGAGRK